jgi:hypothetical protein
VPELECDNHKEDTTKYLLGGNDSYLESFASMKEVENWMVEVKKRTEVYQKELLALPNNIIKKLDA